MGLIKDLLFIIASSMGIYKLILDIKKHHREEKEKASQEERKNINRGE